MGPWDGAADGLAAAVAAVALPAATEAMTKAAIETVWRTRRRGRINQFPISDNLSALMVLVMADLSESQRETLMNLIYQRDIALTDLTSAQRFLIRQMILPVLQHWPYVLAIFASTVQSESRETEACWDGFTSWHCLVSAAYLRCVMAEALHRLYGEH